MSQGWIFALTRTDLRGNLKTCKYMIIVFKILIILTVFFQSHRASAGHPPRFPVFPHKSDKRVNLSSGDVLLQEFAVVVQQSCYCVFCQHVISDLLLHEAELFGYVFL